MAKTTIMKIGLYSPYFPQHFGGGEKHLLAVALALVDQGLAVTICFNGQGNERIEEIVSKYENYFGLNLKKINWLIIKPSMMGLIGRLKWQKEFDIWYLVSDGSIPLSINKKTILHAQIPFTHSLNWWQKLKLANSEIQANSVFTARCLSKAWQISSPNVLHPSVDDEFYNVESSNRKNIVSIGRFFTQLHSKRQDVLIQAYKLLFEKLKDKTPPLVLIGAVEDEEFFARCQSLAEGLNVQFLTKVDKSELLKQLSLALVYWHAAGYEIDEKTHPEKVEHFGMSTAEAMAAGCVPMVIPKGGQPEVIGQEFLNWSWQEPEDLVNTTLKFLSLPETEKSQLSKLARTHSQQFNQDHFNINVANLFQLEKNSVINPNQTNRKLSSTDKSVDSNQEISTVNNINKLSAVTTLSTKSSMVDVGNHAQRAPVSVIIPIYNGLILLKKNLPSVLSQLSSKDQLILVDDCSTEPILEWVKSQATGWQNFTSEERAFSERTASANFVSSFCATIGKVPLIFLQLKINQRFAKAVNTGALFAANPYLLLLNSDVQLTNNAVESLSVNFQTKTNLFAVGCLEKEEISSLTGKEILGGKNKIWFEKGLFVHSRASEFSHGETGWVSGGSGLFDKEKWQVLGGFDPIFYPAYWEDVDLSFRAKKQGWQVLFEPKAVVLHKHESTNKEVFSNSKIQKYSFAHQLFFTQRHAKGWQVFAYYFWQPYWWWQVRKLHNST